MNARWAAVLLAAALAVHPALAQTDAAPVPSSPAATLPMTAVPGAPVTAPAQTARGRQEALRVDQHLADLHRRLRITPAEQRQWDLFAQTVRENAVRMDQLFAARAGAATLNAVEDLRSYAGIAEAHAQDMQRLLPMFEALYGAMSADQRKLADTAFKEFKEFEARGLRRTPRG